MDDMNSRILWDGYGLRLYHGTRTRTGLICKTDKGLRELKKARTGRRMVYYAHDIKEGLYQNGFETISRFYLTVEGEPCFARDGMLYLLEDVLPEKTLEEDSAQAFATGAEALGRMHHHGRGIESRYAQWNQERLPTQLEKRRVELAKIKRRIQRQGSYDAVDIMVLGHYEDYMNRALLAQTLLSQSNYKEQMARAEATHCFCHGSFKGERLRLDGTGQIHVSGFENCTSDVQLMDLAAYLKRYMKKTAGDEAGVQGMLCAYQKYNPLGQEEMLLLQALTAYPEKFLRLMNEFYNKRKACVSPAMQERLHSTIADEEKSNILLEYIGRA